MVGCDIFHSGAVGSFVQFDARNTAVFVIGAKQKSQGGAACAQIQYPGVLGKLGKTGQSDGIGA
jgi:hypothetical protein